MSSPTITPAQYDLLRRANLASLHGLHHTARAFKAMARRLEAPPADRFPRTAEIPFPATRPVLKPAA